MFIARAFWNIQFDVCSLSSGRISFVLHPKAKSSNDVKWAFAFLTLTDNFRLLSIQSPYNVGADHGLGRRFTTNRSPLCSEFLSHCFGRKSINFDKPLIVWKRLRCRIWGNLAGHDIIHGMTTGLSSSGNVYRRRVCPLKLAAIRERQTFPAWTHEISSLGTPTEESYLENWLSRKEYFSFRCASHVGAFYTKIFVRSSKTKQRTSRRREGKETFMASNLIVHHRKISTTFCLRRACPFLFPQVESYGSHQEIQNTSPVSSRDLPKHS